MKNKQDGNRASLKI